MPLRGKPALQNGDVKSPLQKESEVAKRDLSPARPGAQKLSVRIGLAASIGLTRWTRERTGKSACATKRGQHAVPLQEKDAGWKPALQDFSERGRSVRGQRASSCPVGKKRGCRAHESYGRGRAERSSKTWRRQLR